MRKREELYAQGVEHMCIGEAMRIRKTPEKAHVNELKNCYSNFEKLFGSMHLNN